MASAIDDEKARGAEAVAAAAVEGAEQTKSGLVIEHVKEGVGPFPTAASTVSVRGVPSLMALCSIRRREESRRVRRQAGHEGLVLFTTDAGGGTAKLTIPADIARGDDARRRTSRAARRSAEVCCPVPRAAPGPRPASLFARPGPDRHWPATARPSASIPQIPSSPAASARRCRRRCPLGQPRYAARCSRARPCRRCHVPVAIDGLRTIWTSTVIARPAPGTCGNHSDAPRHRRVIFKRTGDFPQPGTFVDGDSWRRWPSRRTRAAAS